MSQSLLESCRLSADEKRFLEFIVHEFPFVRGPNQVESALFSAVQNIFSGSEGNVSIDSYLLHNLAACAWVALEYNKNERIPWDSSEHDSIILRTLRGLMMTLNSAIEQGRITQRDGLFYYGYFCIPDWYISKFRRVKAIGKYSLN